MFLINLAGRESIYEQIRNQIESYIKAGVLKPGDKLPSVRQLASELSINPNTVMKAYQDLEKNGYIYTLNKKGVFVKENENSDMKDKNTLYLLNKLKEDGYKEEELINLIKEVYSKGV